MDKNNLLRRTLHTLMLGYVGSVYPSSTAIEFSREVFFFKLKHRLPSKCKKTFSALAEEGVPAANNWIAGDQSRFRPAAIGGSVAWIYLPLPFSTNYQRYDKFAAVCQ